MNGIKPTCILPLSDAEFEKQWKAACEFISRNSENEGEFINDRDERNSDSKSNKEQQENSKNTAEILSDLALKNIHLLFKDQYGAAYAEVSINDHHEILRVESNKFKRYLFRLFQANEFRFPNQDAINSAVAFLYSKAEYDGPTIPLNLRIAWYYNKQEDSREIYYDLTNEKWQCIRITKNGWSLEQKTSIPLSIRYNQISQDIPNPDYGKGIFDKLLDLVNIKDEQNKLLFKVYLVSLFIPDISIPMLILHGEEGSAKSTLQTLIK